MRNYKFKTIILTFLFCFFILTKNVQASTIIMDLNIDNKTIKYNAEEVVIKLNDNLVKTKEMPAIIMSERTLVPFREVFEEMNCTVDWVQDTYEAVVTNDSIKVTAKINSNVLKVEKNNELKEITLDVPAKIINNKTMVPIRAISESLGAEVNWIQETRTVDIRYTEISDEKIPEELLDENENNDKKENDESSSDKIFKEWKSNNKTKIDETKISYEENKEVTIDALKTNYKNDDYVELILHADGRITNVNVTELDNKLVLDIPNAILNGCMKKVNQDDNYKVEFASNPSCLNMYFGEHDGYLRAVTTLKVTHANYNVSLSNDRKYIYIKIYKTVIKKMTYEENEEKDEAYFTIEANNTIDGVAKLLTDDYRLYIDLNNISKDYKDGTNKISNSNFIKDVRIGNNDTYLRLVLDLNKLYNYKTEKINPNKIKITISKYNFKNLDYSNSDDIKVIKLHDSKLKNLNIKNIKVTEDYMNGIYEVDFNNNYEDEIGLDTFNSKDDVLESFKIYNERRDSKNHTVIKFNGTNKRILAINVSKISDGIEIKIGAPGDMYDEVLYLDAGHAVGNEGTSDRSYGGPTVDSVNVYDEHVLTKKIVDVAYDYLLENSNIKVYLTRESDTKMNNYISSLNDSRKLINGRWMMANSIKPDAAISVHINSMTANKVYDKNLDIVRDKNYKNEPCNVTSYYGTEIVFNDEKNTKGTNYNGMSNRKLAEELVDYFVSQTEGSYFNNGEKELDYLDCRKSEVNGVAFVRESNVPTALLEVGVLNNIEDHEKIINNDYLKKCGEVIAEGIIKIFNKFKLNKN